MIRRTVLFLGVTSCFFSAVLSSQKSQPDLRSQLQDALYVMNRFEEVTTGFDLEINQWKTPQSSRDMFRKEFAMVLRNVSNEKKTLQLLIDKRGMISSSDLFDVYSELMEAGTELNAQSANDGSYGDCSHCMELAKLGAKTVVLGAQIGVTLRSRLVLQEEQLADCSVPKTQKQ